jgi:hypothetical protein
VVYSAMRSQIESMMSLLVNCSNIPSQPIIKKSKLSFNLKVVISGSQTTTFGFPLYFAFLASISPKVRETESLPGKQRSGPYT